MNTEHDVDTERTLLGGCSALLVTGLFAVGGGVPGVISGGVVAATWYLLPAPYAVALGHLVLAVLAADGVGVLHVLLAEAGLVGMLLGPATASDRPLESVARIAGATLALGALVWAGTRWWDAVWPSAVALAVAVGGLSYVLHEYEQYVLARPEESA